MPLVPPPPNTAVSAALEVEVQVTLEVPLFQSAVVPVIQVPVPSWMPADVEMSQVSVAAGKRPASIRPAARTGRRRENRREMFKRGGMIRLADDGFAS